MESSLSDSFTILFTGMLTVFIILGLVFVVGKLLIRITNKFSPTPLSGAANSGATGSVPPSTLAAIVAAVGTVTGEKGRIVKIEKRKN